MLLLEGEEITTVRDALELRKRTSGVGTEEHERCRRVLHKLEEKSRRADQPERKVAGPNSKQWLEF